MSQTSQRPLNGYAVLGRAEHCAPLLALSYEPMFLWQLDGAIEFWNVGAQRLYGYAPNEAIGRVSHTLLETKFPVGLAETLSQLRKVSYWSGELRHTCKDGRQVLVDSRLQLLHDGTVLEVTRDITERKLMEASLRKNAEQIATLAREAEHRSKNLLASVQAIVNLSKADTTDCLKKVIEGRIQALANAHSLFIENRWNGAELSALATQELAAYSAEAKERVTLDGPRIVLDTSVAQVMAVIVHELATNAAKYGALSAITGTVTLTWSHEGDARLSLRWTEAGGPTVRPPTRKGFGSQVIEQMITQRNGEAHFDWHPEGVACEIKLPLQDKSEAHIQHDDK